MEDTTEDTTTNDMRLEINGKTYALDPDDLELGEIEVLEEVCDAPMDSIDFSRAKAMRALVFLMVHRDDESFTMADAAHIKVGMLRDPDQASEADRAGTSTNGAKPVARKRPTKAAARG